MSPLLRSCFRLGRTTADAQKLNSFSLSTNYYVQATVQSVGYALACCLFFLATQKRSTSPKPQIKALSPLQVDIGESKSDFKGTRALFARD